MEISVMFGAIAGAVVLIAHTFKDESKIKYYVLLVLAFLICCINVYIQLKFRCI